MYLLAEIFIAVQNMPSLLSSLCLIKLWQLKSATQLKFNSSTKDKYKKNPVYNFNNHKPEKRTVNFL